MSAQTSIAEQTIVAVFDTPAHAELAVQDLLAAKVPESAISRHTQEGSFSGGQKAVEPAKPQGFWSSLFGDETHADTYVYDQKLASGGSVVTVRGIPDHDFDSVAAILEKHHPIEFDDHGASAATTTTTSTIQTAAPAAASTSTVADSGTLQLSEESLVVGKRLVNRGSTRIRKYVIETPVEENVTLHDEKVTIQRRPITAGDAVTNADFSEKVIEMTETGEEAVVGKTARVVEEVGLRKEGVDRTETIHDTVRKEEVEVTTVPGGASTSDKIDPSLTSKR